MVFKVRTSPWFMDSRSWGRFQNGSWSLLGGELASLPSTVSADYPLRDWRRLIARGDCATTSLSASKSGLLKSPPKLDVKFTMPRRVLNASIEETHAILNEWNITQGKVAQFATTEYKGKAAIANLSLYTDNSLFDKVDTMAIMGFRRKLNAARRNLQTFVSIGEMAQTVRMLRRPFQGFRNRLTQYDATLESMIKRSAGGNPSLMDDIADAYLEYSFGARPFIADIDGLLKTAIDCAYRRPDRRIVKYTACLESAQNGNDNVATSFVSIRVRRRRERRRHFVSVRYLGSVGLSPDRATSGLGVDSPVRDFVPTVYELIPWSWLVDYFSNVGAILDAVTSGIAGVRWIQRSHLIYQDSHWSDIEFDNLSSLECSEWGIRRRGDTGTQFTASISREQYFGQLLPSFQLTYPHNMSQLLNLGALGYRFRSMSSRVREIVAR